MAVLCPTGTVSNLLPILKNQILDYNNYEQGLIKVIGFPGYAQEDRRVDQELSYSQWIGNYQSFPVIKVEGLERLDLKLNLPKVRIKNIHLFYNQKFGYSFNWHRDDVNVILAVLQGRKYFQSSLGSKFLYPGSYAVIPKGRAHRVCSNADTWALSIGY